MVDLSSYLVTGTNNGNKQVSVTNYNGLINAIEGGINSAAASGGSGPWVSLADYLEEDRTPFVTDDLPAFEAALAALAAADGGESAVPRLLIPSGSYYCSDAINVHVPCYIQDANGMGAGTLIRFAPNKNGFVFNHSNTHGDTTGAQGNGGGSTLEGVYLYGGNVTVDGSGAVTSYAAGVSPIGKGVRIRGAFVACKDVAVSFFGEDGFNIEATAGSGGSTEGNANSFYLERCQSIYNGRYGYVISGNDANAGITIACSAVSNGGCGFVEYSFLGNTHIQPHARDNGYADPTGNLGPVGVCTYDEHQYYVKAGKLTEASTTTPGTDATVWVQYDGLLNSRTWVTGQTWVIGGAYATNPGNANGRNVFVGTYGEAGQAPIQAFEPTVFMGGLVEELTFNSSSTCLWHRCGSYGSSRALAFEAVQGATTTTLGLYANRILTHADGTDTFTLEKTSGGTLAFTLAGSILAYVYGSGVELPSGKAFRINGQQVVGARGAAVADATDAATAITQLNALLARLRTHGLIAT